MTGYVPPRLRFLHLTDCHFSDDFRSQDCWNNLLSFLEHSRPTLDFVFATGDIADKNLAGGYQYAREFFARLGKILPRGSERIFIVPGNHDVDREQASLLACNAESLPMVLSKAKRRQLAELPFYQFKLCLSDIGAPGSDLAEACTAVPGTSIRILQLNTAWLARNSENDQGKLALWIDRWDELLSKDSVDSYSLSVALSHHSPSWLHLTETRRFERLICKHADILLCGHIHEEDVKTFTIDNHSCVLVTGAAVGGSDFPFQRALIGELDADGLRLHRILRDPARAGTADEWYSALSTVRPLHLHRLLPAEESGASTTHVSAELGARIRQHWHGRFSKDLLIGFLSESNPRDLLAVYRKLSLSPLTDSDEGTTYASLWLRLRNAASDDSIEQVMTNIRDRIRQMDYRSLRRIDRDTKPYTLTGNPTTDLDFVTEYCLRELIQHDLPTLTARSGDLSRWETLSRAVARSDEEELSTIGFLGTAGIDTSVASPVDWRFILYLMLLRMPSTVSSDPDICTTAASKLIATLPSFAGSRSVKLKDLLATLNEFDTNSVFSAVRQGLTGSSTITDASRVSAHLKSINIIARRISMGELIRLLTANEIRRRDLAQLIEYVDSEGADANVWELVVSLLDLDALTQTFVSMWPKHADAQAHLMMIVTATASLVGPGDESPPLSTKFVEAVLAWVHHALGAPSGDTESVYDKLISNAITRGADSSERYAMAAEQLRSKDVDRRDVLRLARHLVELSYRRSLRDTIDVPAVTFDEIRSEIDLYSTGGTKPICIIGGPGSGKTTLLRHLCLTSADDELPIFVPLKLWNHQSSLAVSLIASLDEAGTTIDEIRDWLSLRSGRRLLLLLDGLDEVRDLTEAVKFELERFVSDWSPFGQIVITARSSASRFLPDLRNSHRYTLNKLSEDDVFVFIESWFWNDIPLRTYTTNRIITDRGLAQELRVPFVLRMFCSLITYGEEPNAWSSRTGMYRDITRHLLEGRDAGRGIPLYFSYESKIAILTHVAASCFEQGLGIIPAQSLIDFATDALASVSREDVIKILNEIVARSQLLVRVNDTSYDFAHFTLREYFGALAWSQNGAWRGWLKSEARSFLAYESVPRFIAGFSPGSIDEFVDVFSESLGDSPFLELAKAGIRAEVFEFASTSSKVLTLRSTISIASENREIDLDEVSALIARMLRWSNPEIICDAITSRLLDIPTSEEQDVRVLALMSLIHDDSVASAVSNVLIRSRTDLLRDAAAQTLAKMRSDPALRAVKGALDSRHEELLLATCFLSSEWWTTALRDHYDKRLDEAAARISQIRARQERVDMMGVTGSADCLVKVQLSIESLIARMYSKHPRVGVPILRDDDFDRIVFQAGATALERLRTFWAVSAVDPSGRIMVADHPDVAKAVAAVVGCNIGIGSRRDTDVSSDLELGALLRIGATTCDSPVADAWLVRIERWSGRARWMLRDAIEASLTHFEQFIPRDVVSACQQLVDDMWVSANPGSRRGDSLIIAKGKRAAFVRQRLDLDDLTWIATSRVVESLSLRPEKRDWFYLQRRFSGLMKALQRRLGRGGMHSAGRPLSETSWDLLHRAHLKLLQET